MGRRPKRAMRLHTGSRAEAFLAIAAAPRRCPSKTHGQPDPLETIKRFSLPHLL